MENEILEENKRLKERIQYLENVLSRGNTGNSNAYNTIRGMIISKVQNEIDFTIYDEWRRKHERQKKERQIMRDLLWNIRVRRVTELRTEHIEQAEKFIQEYKFEEA